MTPDQRQVLEEFNRSISQIIKVPMDDNIKAPFAFQAGFILSLVLSQDNEIEKLKARLILREAKKAMDDNGF